MNSVEVERKRVEELQLLVVLEQLSLLQPLRGLGILDDLRLQPLLPFEFAVEHLVGQRPVLLGDLVQQHQLGESVAAVIEAPAVHARNQPAIGMMALIEIRRQAARDCDVFRRRLGEIVRQAGFLVDRRIAVEFEPALIVIGNHVSHQVERRQCLEAIVAERSRELPAQSGVLVHHDGKARRAVRRCLNDHQTTLCWRRANTVRAVRARAYPPAKAPR